MSYQAIYNEFKKNPNSTVAEVSNRLSLSRSLIKTKIAAMYNGGFLTRTKPGTNYVYAVGKAFDEKAIRAVATSTRNQYKQRGKVPSKPATTTLSVSERLNAVAFARTLTRQGLADEIGIGLSTLKRFLAGLGSKTSDTNKLITTYLESAEGTVAVAKVDPLHVRMKNYRAARNVTQAEMANKFGFSKHTWNYYEHNLNVNETEISKKISAFLDTADFTPIVPLSNADFRATRVNHGLSVGDLSYLLNTNQQNIYCYETGTKPVSIKLSQRLQAVTDNIKFASHTIQLRDNVQTRFALPTNLTKVEAAKIIQHVNSLAA